MKNESEFQKIFYAIFGNLQNENELQEKYEQAVHELIAKNYERKTDALNVEIKNIHTDEIESLELYLRLRFPNNTLTQKFKILIFLCESRSQYYDFFINEKDESFIKVFFKLSIMTLRSVWLIFRGYNISRKYHCLT